MLITTVGGNASKGTRTYRVTIPNLWAQDWDVIKEDRDIMITFLQDSFDILPSKSGYQVKNK